MLRRLLHTIPVLSALLLVGAGTISKVRDYDVWWHVKAGQVMLETGHLIRTDPFAFTRTDQPYLATHEWLSQVVFAFVVNILGFNGLIILRVIIAGAIACLLLWTMGKTAWLASPFVIFLHLFLQPNLLDRPQLFTFLFFPLCIVLAARYMSDAAQSWRRSLPVTAGCFLVIEILWVNLHGAAGLLAIIIFGALLLQRLADRWRGSTHKTTEGYCELLWLSGALALLLFSMLLSPNGFGALTYLASLLYDRTVQFIAEWSPSPWGAYLWRLGWLWVAALLTLTLVRRHTLFWIILLLATGILSRTAARHEPIVILALGFLTLQQLSQDERWQRVSRWLLQRRGLTSFLLLIVFSLAVTASARTYDRLTLRDQLQGFGTFEPARGAYAFLEESNIAGNTFNNYEIGGYLLYRGYPERLVFIDGRNVDYGFTFMEEATRAAYDPVLWRELSHRYDLTAAIIYFDAYADVRPIPYVRILDHERDWKRVYMDDWSAVYVKNDREDQTVVASSPYTLLTPEYLEGGVAAGIEAEDRSVLERELLRAIASSPESIKARILLAGMYADAGHFDEAAQLLQAAIAAQPGRYQPLQTLGDILVTQGKWEEAGEAYERALQAAGWAGSGFDYGALSSIFERAGNAEKAARYRAME